MRPADHLEQAMMECLAVPRAMGVITDDSSNGIVEPADAKFCFFADLTSSTVSSHFGSLAPSPK